MSSDRYVVLGLALPRSTWFREIAQWSNAGSIPVEFVKCVSPEEARARLESGRPFSALLVDGASPALDRDLVDLASKHACACIVVDGSRRDWTGIGVTARLEPKFDRTRLLEVLGTHARLIASADEVNRAPTLEEVSAWRGRVIAVCGPGGTGASTAAIAIAQALARELRYGGAVALVDLCRRADQAMLHAAPDIVPGIEELVDAHRNGRPSPEDVRAATFFVPERGYSLLLGLRQPRSWSALRPRTFEAAFTNLTQSFRALVCDVDNDFEGESEGGSIDVEERNVMSRTALGAADVVLVVGVGGVKGIHSLVRLVADLLAFGISPERLIPVVNRTPRSPKVRSSMTATVAQLLAPLNGSKFLPSPIFLPERSLEPTFMDGTALPTAITDPLAGAVHAALSRVSTEPRASRDPEPVAVGSLGNWTDDEAAAG